MGIKRKWLYYGNRVRLTETMRDLLLNSKYLQLCLNIGFRHLRVNNQTILWGGRGRLAPCFTWGAVSCVPCSWWPHSTPLRCLSQDCCSHWRATGWGQSDHWGWPWLTWRQPPAETRASDLRQSQTVADCGAGRSHENNINTTERERERIMYNDFPYLHSPGTSCVYFVQYLFPFAFYNCIIYYILYSTSTQHRTHCTYHAIQNT